MICSCHPMRRLKRAIRTQYQVNIQLNDALHCQRSLNESEAIFVSFPPWHGLVELKLHSSFLAKSTCFLFFFELWSDVSNGPIYGKRMFFPLTLIFYSLSRKKKSCCNVPDFLEYRQALFSFNFPYVGPYCDLATGFNLVTLTFFSNIV